MNEGERHNCEFQRMQMDETSFYYFLLRAIYKSDLVNRAKLRLAFPEEVEAVTRWQTEDGYAKAIMLEYDGGRP